MSKKRFHNKVVLITGASSGIGKATAIAFAREGAVTVLAARREETLRRVAEEIEGAGGKAFVAPVDVSSPDQVRRMVADVVAEYGRIDILFNNAGTSMVGRIDGEDFVDNTRKMFEIDYLGTVHVLKEVLPVMKRQRSGHVMNMSSVVGRKAFPGFGGYSSVMYALSGLTEALRQELRGTGINVSVIHPALTQTPLLSAVNRVDMPPPFRNLTPIPVEDVASAVLDGVHKKRLRTVVSFPPKMLLLADAISPRLGDLIVRLLENKLFGRLIGSYKGSVYQHEPAT